MTTMDNDLVQIITVVLIYSVFSILIFFAFLEIGFTFIKSLFSTLDLPFDAKESDIRAEIFNGLKASFATVNEKDLEKTFKIYFLVVPVPQGVVEVKAIGSSHVCVFHWKKIINWKWLFAGTILPSFILGGLGVFAPYVSVGLPVMLSIILSSSYIWLIFKLRSFLKRKFVLSGQQKEATG